MKTHCNEYPLSEALEAKLPVWQCIPRHMALVPYVQAKRTDWKSVILIGLMLIPIITMFWMIGGMVPFIRMD